MNTIVSWVGIFENLIGFQPIDKTKKYRLLKFCFFERADENTLLLYNNLTKEMLSLNNDEASLFNNSEFYCDSPIIEELIKKWFLVPEDHNDLKLCDTVTFFAKQANTNRSITSYNIFTTTTCNARCYYCFEAGTRTSTMSTETAIATAEYIIKHCDNKKVSIQWFGGEPLCNMQAIDIICQKLRDSNIEYTSTIISNGYLFDGNVTQKAKNDWNLTLAQITIDGMQETYNRVKNYVHNNPNPFARVISNIRLLLEQGINVDVRMNMDLYNELELYKLTDYLKDHFSAYKNFVVHANLIYEDVGFTPTKRTDEEREYIFDKYFDLYKHFNETKLARKPVLSNRVLVNRCMADSYNATQISPDGNLGNCEHYPDKFFYGTVFENTPRQIWTDYVDKIDECYDCPIYPTCFILKRCNTNHCTQFRRRKHSIEIKEAMVNTYFKKINKDGSVG